MEASRRRLSRRLRVVVGALLPLACAGPGMSPLHALGLGRVDNDEEREIGRAFDRDLEAGGQLVRDREVNGFLLDLGLDLVAQIEPQPFVYRFRVVRDPSLNAFAVPGGYVYVHSGTILRAGSLDELAGVIGHEIGHVDGHHFARLQARTALPDLLANLAAVGAAVAVGQPAVAWAGQGLNEALKLRWSRDLEREADERSGAIVARAGFDPGAIAGFFERIRDEADPTDGRVPPYLYSHPDVADRIESVRARAGHWRELQRAMEARAPSHETQRAALEASFRRARERLAELVDARPEPPPPPVRVDPARSEPLLARAEEQSARGDTRGALRSLDEAGRIEPHDPRVPFRRGELLELAGDPDGALAAYRCTLDLDPSRGLVYYRVGLLRRDRGERHRAVHALEEAWFRFAPDSTMRRRADYEIAKLEYGVFRDAALSPTAEGLVWTGRVRERFRASEDRIRVRWLGPDGALVREDVPRARGGTLSAKLGRPPGTPLPTGTWTVEAWLDGAVVTRSSAWLR